MRKWNFTFKSFVLFCLVLSSCGKKQASHPEVPKEDQPKSDDKKPQGEASNPESLEFTPLSQAQTKGAEWVSPDRRFASFLIEPSEAAKNWARKIIFNTSGQQSYSVQEFDPKREFWTSGNVADRSGFFVDPQIDDENQYQIGGINLGAKFPGVFDIVLKADMDLNRSYKAHRVYVPQGEHLSLAAKSLKIQAHIFEFHGMFLGFNRADGNSNPNSRAARRSSGSSGGSLEVIASHIRIGADEVGKIPQFILQGQMGGDGNPGAQGRSYWIKGREDRNMFGGHPGEKGAKGGSGGFVKLSYVETFSLMGVVLGEDVLGPTMSLSGRGSLYLSHPHHEGETYPMAILNGGEGGIGGAGGPSGVMLALEEENKRGATHHPDAVRPGPKGSPGARGDSGDTGSFIIENLKRLYQDRIFPEIPGGSDQKDPKVVK